MNNENVFVLKFIDFDNIIQKYCVNIDVNGCIKLNNNHYYVRLVQDMNIGDVRKLDGQDVMIELIYKGNLVKYENNSLFSKKISPTVNDKNELFINITNTEILRPDKIYFYIYYRPTEKYIEGKYSNLILNGLKKYPKVDYHNNYQGYFNEFIFLKDKFKDKFINKFKINNNFLLCGIPSHIASNKNENSISLMIHMLSRECGIQDGSQILERYKSIEAQKNVGKREIKTHLESIRVAGNVSNKTIILLDDVTTSGSTLLACKKLLIEAGANSVYCFAFGKSS